MTEAMIGVLVPAYNPGTALERSVASLQENVTAFHVVVVDDGNTPPLTVAPLAAGSSVEVLRNSRNLGLTPTLNVGLRALLDRGVRYVARLDCGDLSAPGRLDRQASFLDRNPGVAAVGSWATFVHPDGGHAFDFTPPTSHRELLSYLRLNNPFIHSSIMFRAEALIKYGIYDERCETAQDYEIMWRIARHCDVAILPEMLTVYEIGPGGISRLRRHSQLRNRLRIQLRYFEPWHPRAYWGVIRTLLLMGTPVTLVDRIKQHLRATSPTRPSSDSR